MTDKPAPQTGRIFISYRRADSAGYAGRIYDRLATHFGKDALFMDVDTIQAGLDFVDVLENAVQSCDVVVALLGRQWLNIKDEAGKRRLDNPQDFVRIEVAAALDRGIRVIPVLVDGTSMPNSGQLPDNLKPLARRNAVLVSHYSFHTDVNRLIEQLELALKTAEESKALKAKKLKEEEVQKKRQAEIENLLAQADIALDLKDWDLAKEQLTAALTLEPNHVQAQIKLVIVERKQRESKEKAEQETATKATKEKKEAEETAKEKADRLPKQKDESEAAEKAAKEKAERDTIVKVTREKTEDETRLKNIPDQTDRKAAERTNHEEAVHLALTTAPPKSPIIALLLSSFLFGGTGQLYLGQTKKGITLIIITLLGSLFIIGGFVGLYGAIDAYAIAEKMRAGSSVGEWEFGFSWKGLLIAGAVSVITAIIVIGLLSLTGYY